MPETPQLYGLLVAIDDYSLPVPPLGGCVNDIRKVKNYLETKHQDLQPQLLVLENEAATKAAIVDGFRKHLAQAGPEDTALFYFSGHGTQEDADPGLWPYEPDGKLECLVNYDAIVKEGESTTYNLLADKELRFLLHELADTQAHIIVIFDCCHSGSGTRDLDHSEEGEKIQPRSYETSRLTKACPQRPWEQFLFADQIDATELAKKPLPRVLPAGQHVMMGACRSDQLAYEVNGGGVFTSTLLSLLEGEEATISYFDLRNRIRYMVKNEYQQTPQVYVQGPDSQQLFSGFLGREVSRRLNEGNVVYNKTEGWVLDLGAMHGIAPDLKSIHVDDAEGEPFTAQVSSVKMSHTRLSISDPEVMTRLNPTKGYRTAVPGALAQPIRVLLAVEGEGRSHIEQEMAGFKDRLLLVDTEQNADYVIREQNDGFMITLPFDPVRAVVHPTDNLSAKAAKNTIIYLRNMAKWHFVRELHNPNVFLFEKSPAELEIYRVKNDLSQELLPLEGEEVVLNFRKVPSGDWGNMIRIKLTNRYSSRLYCSLIYLSETFQIYSGLLGEPVVFLEPGQSVWAYSGNELPLDYARHIQVQNWPNSFFWLKLMVSTREFDPATFDQSALPMVTDAVNRGIALSLPGKIAGSDWTTELIRFRMPNPEYREESEPEQ
ncbi:caspase family protein [Flavilitoribacter nigricans]|uniref:Peptidase C14 caspase domain-containing protein n=1 Tax=Flavilitoribacter nigricans (strain ATCC 23147 / DSM 23189 / NBRC 102662 / NCIMB 1420 / SS-2) TaxID=1122177 RepID=A0A2D0NII9_FLAN2|nr:caspase family protein [Flavilitoribacter nigricans]PHN08311.1 hypothetical protein CRP01_03025 [Flavilitoribacter nigricans DSM 23189 = NBRC 102662]